MRRGFRAVQPACLCDEGKDAGNLLKTIADLLLNGLLVPLSILAIDELDIDHGITHGSRVARTDGRIGMFYLRNSFQRLQDSLTLPRVSSMEASGAVLKFI